MALEALVKLFKKFEIKGTGPLEREIQQHAMLEAMRKMMKELEAQIYNTQQAMYGNQQIAGLQEQLGINADTLSELGLGAQGASSRASRPFRS